VWVCVAAPYLAPNVSQKPAGGATAADIRSECSFTQHEVWCCCKRGVWCVAFQWLLQEVKSSEGGAPEGPPLSAAAAAAAAAAANSSKRSSTAGGGNKLVVRDDAVTLKEV